MGGRGRYEGLLEAVWGGAGIAEEGGAGAVPNEMELQSRWYAGEWGKGMRTTDGREVEVVDFGVWNHAAGADFWEVVVLLDGVRKRGKLELDVEARGWESHGHSANPAYNDVVLHVFFGDVGRGRFFTRTSDDREVPQVWLDLDGGGGGRRRRGVLPEAKAGRCSRPLEGMEAGRVRTLLAAAAEYRVGRKVKRLVCAEAAQGREQAVFQGVAEALGYRRNKLAMTVLAQRLPLKLLAKAGGEAEALIFGVAGFLEGRVFEGAADDTREYLRGLWDCWWKRRSEYAPEEGRGAGWVFSGSRPVNHPQRRVAALARVAAGWKGLWAAVDGGDVRAVRDFLTGMRHGYWSCHYTLTSKRSAREMALVGEARANEMLANVFFPYWAGRGDDVWGEYCKLPARLENEKSRRGSLRLLGERGDAGELAGTMCGQQGLLQLYEDFCLEDDSGCEDCPFPEQLGQW
ncbi:MAG: DUF2851 family protein [Verrucomicrobiales bacterium]|nr:DUF2851 family protein [Verrucomicrobiales bacterium]